MPVDDAGVNVPFQRMLWHGGISGVGVFAANSVHSPPFKEYDKPDYENEKVVDFNVLNVKYFDE